MGNATAEEGRLSDIVAIVPGVSILVGFPHVLKGNVCVNLRRRQTLVAEQFLNRHEIRTVFE